MATITGRLLQSLLDENIRLKRSLEAAEKSIDRHVKKVKLPREVVEAIERKHPSLHQFQFIDSINQGMRGLPVERDAKIVADWLQSGDIHTKATLLLQALVNGHEIEETQDDRIQRGIREIYEKWNNEPITRGWKDDRDELAKRIYNYVKGELENTKSG